MENAFLPLLQLIPLSMLNLFRMNSNKENPERALFYGRKIQEILYYGNKEKSERRFKEYLWSALLPSSHHSFEDSGPESPIEFIQVVFRFALTFSSCQANSPLKAVNTKCDGVVKTLFNKRRSLSNRHDKGQQEIFST